MVSASAVQSLRSRFHGTVLVPSDLEYDAARALRPKSVSLE